MAFRTLLNCVVATPGYPLLSFFFKENFETAKQNENHMDSKRIIFLHFFNFQLIIFLTTITTTITQKP